MSVGIDKKGRKITVKVAQDDGKSGKSAEKEFHLKCKSKDQATALEAILKSAEKLFENSDVDVNKVKEATLKTTQGKAFDIEL
jgi:hypothetical protein